MESTGNSEHSDVTRQADSTELYFGDVRFSGTVDRRGPDFPTA